MEEGEIGLSIGSVRPTPLGTNMYSGKHNPVDHLNEQAPNNTRPEPGRKEEDGGGLAKEELNLLAKLIGTETGSSRSKEFKLHLFEGEAGEEEEMNEQQQQRPNNVVNIDLKSKRGGRGDDLERIIQEMTVEAGEEEDDDLLALMDKAS